MSRTTLALLLCLGFLVGATAWGGDAVKAEAGQPAPAGRISMAEDPNDPNASPEERLERQKALILRRLAERNQAISEGQRQEREAFYKLAGQVKASTTTLAVEKHLAEMLVLLYQEVADLPSSLNVIPTVSKAPPRQQADQSGAPVKTYKLELEFVYEGGKPMKAVAYADKKFEITTPLITDLNPSGMKGVGSIGFSGEITAATNDRVQLDFQVDLNIPVLQTYNYGSGKSGSSSGQMTFTCGSQGKTTMMLDKPKEIMQAGTTVVKATVMLD